jgi:hypothetical protein
MWPFHSAALARWDMRNDSKTGTLVRFRGTVNGLRVVGKCAPTATFELGTEIGAINAILATPAAPAIKGHVFAGMVDGPAFRACFSGEMPYQETTVDVVMALEFDATLMELLTLNYTPLDAWDKLILTKLALVFQSAALLRGAGWAHQDLKLDNCRTDGTLFDLETAVGPGLNCDACHNHPVGWRASFAETTEASDMFTAIQSLFCSPFSTICTLPRLCELRRRLFGLAPDESRSQMYTPPGQFSCTFDNAQCAIKALLAE